MISRRVVAYRLLLGAVTIAVSIGAAMAATAADVSPATEAPHAARLLALDCGRLAGQRDWLAQLPAPRVVNLQGSIPIVTMEPFAEFLMAMGYPESALRDPADRTLSRSSYTSSKELAGMLAWYYERDGLRPMLIGHSQGGMLVVRTLHELAGAFHDSIPVFDPVLRQVLPRTTICDPFTRADRPVVGLPIAFGAALATGMLPRVLLLQWSMLPRLRKIPDTTEEFTGFTVAWDPIAGNFATAERYAATGTARVRNVLLPASYSHIGLPITGHLAANPVTRAWLDAFVPDTGAEAMAPADPALNVSNLLHAADLWYSIRLHWCREGQRLLRARNCPTCAAN